MNIIDKIDEKLDEGRYENLYGTDEFSELLKKLNKYKVEISKLKEKMETEEEREVKKIASIQDVDYDIVYDSWRKFKNKKKY